MTLTVIGPMVAGEIPEPLEYTWLDADGAALDLDGYTAAITWRVADGTQEERAADLAANVLTYQWVDGDLATPGTYRGELIVTNATNTYARRWCMRVRPPMGGTFPD